MDALAALLLTVSHSPHSGRGHDIGACVVYFSLGCILRDKKRLVNSEEVQFSGPQRVLMGLLFALGSVLQPPTPKPLTLLFLPLFCFRFSDFPLCILSGFLAWFASKNPITAFLHLFSTSTLGLLGAHDQDICLYFAFVCHLIHIALAEGEWSSGISYGAYSAVARVLFLRAAPLAGRGLLLLCPLALLDLLSSETVPLLLLPLALTPLFAGGGRDTFPFLCVPLACVLAHQASSAA